MEVMYPRCCGLDVHKSSITACVLLAQAGKPLKHIRRFGCTTRELRDLVAWLRQFGWSTWHFRCKTPSLNRGVAISPILCLLP